MKKLKLSLITLIFLTLLYGITGSLFANTDSLQFFCKENLSRPEANSITINACANENLSVYFEYGTDSTNYTNHTNVISCQDSVPFVVVLNNLSPNTEYYYRMRYLESGKTTYAARSSHSFHTQRPAGSTFTFAVEADPHMDANTIPSSWVLTLQNMLSVHPDFLIDLGDNFMSEKLLNPTQDSITLRHLYLRTFYDVACHSIPLFLVMGNHEGELGWLNDTTLNSLPVMAANTRLKYYQNPLPDAFYTGNTVSEKNVGLRENYYSWQWGDALFIVLDNYWYTKSKPDWGWSLGIDQYNWFKNVISSSKAKFKFVFCHQLDGGNGVDGRGGTEYANFWEMGGENADSTWGFDTNRPNWGGPVHTLMLENNASIFFHGHDHCYAKQEKDGIIYQEVPQPSAKNIKNITGTQYGYVEGVLMPSRGYLLVTVADTGTRVDYVKTYMPNEENATTKNNTIAYSYSIKPTVTSVDNSIFNSQFSIFNYPNPFNQQTTIKYRISAANNVQIKIYDILGRELTTLINKYQLPGTYTISVNADKLLSAAGMYYYKIISGNYSETKSMILMK